MKFDIKLKLILYVLSIIHIYSIKLKRKTLIYIIENEDTNNNILTNGKKVINEAMKLVGKYVYSFGGGNINGPSLGKYKPNINHCDDRKILGFDCGGFVLYSYYKALNKKLPHGPKLLYKKAKKEKRLLPITKVKPGDLLFYGSKKNPDPEYLRHVVLYAGNGMILQSEGHFNPSCKPKLISYQPLYLNGLVDVAARFWD